MFQNNYEKITNTPKYKEKKIMYIYGFRKINPDVPDCSTQRFVKKITCHISNWVPGHHVWIVKAVLTILY